MGAIGKVFGIGGGGDFAKPAQAEITPTTNPEQLNGIYSQNMQGLEQQKALLAALAGQGGIQNQSAVYNQLQDIASGKINPAQAQFNQNTGANVANQAALMAGQRGASANVGLMARQAGMQGAGIQQQAAGQSAIQQAQNQIAGIQAAGNMANTMAGQQIAQQNTNVASRQNEQQQLLNAMAQYNNAKVGSQSSVNSGNAALAGQQMNSAGGIFGGLANAVGAGLGTIFGPAKTGAGSAGVGGPGGNPAVMGPGFANGGSVGPQSSLAQYLCGGNMAKGGGVPVVVSPGEKVALPGEVAKLKAGGTPSLQTVPGKPRVAGDSLKNDTVPAKLPPGSVVVKRSRANNDPEGFIREVLSKRGKKK